MLCSAYRGCRKYIYIIYSYKYICNLFHGLQHARPLCPSLSPRVFPSSCPLNWWCHSIISSSVIYITYSYKFAEFTSKGCCTNCSRFWVWVFRRVWTASACWEQLKLEDPLPPGELGMGPHSQEAVVGFHQEERLSLHLEVPPYGLTWRRLLGLLGESSNLGL